MKRIKYIIVLMLSLSIAAVAKESDSKNKTTLIWSKLVGKELINSKKEKKPVQNLSNKKIVGLYFSAHWCPPCRKFTPKLIRFYQELLKRGKSFEVVFISCDRDSSAMIEYMREMGMPWLAIPFADAHKQTLKKTFSIKSIPTLVILDGNGNLITKNGRKDVSQLSLVAYDKWLKDIKK